MVEKFIFARRREWETSDVQFLKRISIELPNATWKKKKMIKKWKIFHRKSSHLTLKRSRVSLIKNVVIKILAESINFWWGKKKWILQHLRFEKKQKINKIYAWISLCNNYFRRSHRALKRPWRKNIILSQTEK